MGLSQGGINSTGHLVGSPNTTFIISSDTGVFANNIRNGIPTVISKLASGLISNGNTTDSLLGYDATTKSITRVARNLFSSSSNFMDLTTDQNVGGNKSFTGSTDMNYNGISPVLSVTAQNALASNIILVVENNSPNRNNGSILNINMSNTLSNSNISLTGGTINVTNTGTNNTNVGLNLNASGGTQNITARKIRRLAANVMEDRFFVECKN